MIFNEVVEAVKNLSSDEQQELKYLIEQYLKEEKREEIYKDYLNSKKALQDNKLQFSDDIDELMDSLEN